MDAYYNGDSELLDDYWDTIFYDGGEWMIEAPMLSVSAIYDVKDLSLIRGEYHPTLGNSTPQNPKGEMLDILLGQSEESQTFLENMKTKTVDILIADNGKMFLVAMNQVRFSDNDTVRGYVLVAADMRFYLQSISNSK